MRITLNIAEDAYRAARQLARRERMSLGDAVSKLIRCSASAHDSAASTGQHAPLRGRFALLPARDEVVTAQHVRALMERNGI